MASLFSVTNCEPMQAGFQFPQSLTEKYRPQTLAEFAGMEKQRTILTNFARRPYATSFLFTGAPGTGKTSAWMALAAEIPAEIHHVPSQECTVDNLKRIVYTCHMMPMSGLKMHLVGVDEIDLASPAADAYLLSKLDETARPPNTVFCFTCNDVMRVSERFRSRCKTLEFSTYGLASEAVSLLSKVWTREAGQAPAPNFARIVKEANNNVREALQTLETELLAV